MNWRKYLYWRKWIEKEAVEPNQTVTPSGQWVEKSENLALSFTEPAAPINIDNPYQVEYQWSMNDNSSTIAQHAIDYYWIETTAYGDTERTYTRGLARPRPAHQKQRPAPIHVEVEAPTESRRLFAALKET